MAKSQKILIIDDDSTVAKVISELFTRKGFETIVEAKAEKALSIMRVEKIDGVVLDCMIPGMNGVDLAKKFREELNFQESLILISGIFKDKNFAKNSIRKSGATDFMFKPLDLDVLLEYFVDRSVETSEGTSADWYSKLSYEKVDIKEAVDSLLKVEKINSKEIPLLISSVERNQLNLFIELKTKDETLSMKTSQGKIYEIDSNKKSFLSKEYIVKENLCTSELIGAHVKGKNNLVDELIERALLSPHLKTEIVNHVGNIILKQALLSGEEFDVEISKIESIKRFHAFESKNISYVVHELVDVRLDPLFLQSFFSHFKNNMVGLDKTYDKNMQLQSLPLVSSQKEFVNNLKEKMSIAKIMEEKDAPVKLKTLFLLQCMGYITVYDTVVSLEDMPKLEQRFKVMHDGINGKSPDEVFKFLGVEDTRALFVAPFFKNFAKTNHPDKLPQIAPDSLRRLNQKVFSIISEAHGILTDPEKKKAYIEEVNNKKTEEILKAEALKEKGQIYLKKSDYRKAMEYFEDSRELHPDNMTTLYYYWCYMKVNKKIGDKNLRMDIYNELVAFPIENKRNELFCLVLGILYKRSKRYEDSIAEFKKSLGFNENFLPARRELMQLQSQLKSIKAKSGTNVFGTDLGTVVSNIFKKKSN